MKPATKSKTIRFAVLWAVLNAIALAVEASLHLVQDYVSPLALLAINVAVAGVVAALHTITRDPITWTSYEPDDDDHYGPGYPGAPPVVEDVPPGP